MQKIYQKQDRKERENKIMAYCSNVINPKSITIKRTKKRKINLSSKKTKSK